MSPGATICPRFDHCDPRCGARTTLGHLDEVFRFCTADFESCPTFRASGVGGGAVGDDGGGRRGNERALVHASCGGEAESARFGRCDGPIADDLASGIVPDIATDIATDIARIADACIGAFVELTVERAPIGRPNVA